MRQLITLSAGIWILSSCAVTSHIASPELPLPPKPLLPEIQGQDLQCLMPTAYDALVKRDRLRAAYEDELRVVLCATHKAHSCQ